MPDPKFSRVKFIQFDTFISNIEISDDKAMSSPGDLIMAISRSDFPNQEINIPGFPTYSEVL